MPRDTEKNTNKSYISSYFVISNLHYTIAHRDHNNYNIYFPVP